MTIPKVLVAGLLVLPFGALLPARSALAETVTLIDGTKISGEILHTWKGVYTVKTAQGEVELPKAKIKSISFEIPPARAMYSTPEKTLEAWRTATASGDVSAMMDAYALMYQGMVQQEFEQMGFKEKSEMVTGVTSTKFTVKDKKIVKDKATLTVDQEKDGETRTGDIHFVLENGEWKMTP